MKSQISLFQMNKKGKARGRKRLRPERCFGGHYFKNYNPQTKRPMDSKKALHVVLKSSQAVGAFSMKNAKVEERIWQIVEKHGKANGIKIYEYSNAGNHIHLLIRVPKRELYNRFIRSISGLIARTVRGAERGRPLSAHFWDSRPFSRIVEFAGGDFKKVKLYLSRNTFEAIGFIPHLKRSKKLSPQWKAFWINLTTTPV